MAATSVTWGCGCSSSPASTSRRCGRAYSYPSASICVSTSLSFLRSAGAAKHLHTRLSSPVLLRVRRPWRSSFGAREGDFRPGKNVSRDAEEDDELRDDDAAINDLESYLGDMSLEYDSVWDTKPAWCQPWTIVASGVGVITTSWILFHNVFLTGGASIVIGLWWFAFLYQYPLGYSEMIAERRKLVKDGREDTYGTRVVE